ncbi:hypothetical protein FSARC_2021 [Fusarium sarcochroum]|uniref:BTB domain-containing protein n=1 Tax=Fusarium sarcochroum TaxID=1208366 RepID=A0A8H4XDE9_9HYPO|nr:hypothetical protein FSARC_2021 [Fusarium sarcochroum]
MLRGQFAERKPEDGEWKVTLPEDKNTAFAVLMDMAHGLYLRTREIISYDELYDICVLTNKYDMACVLRPMASRWFRDLIKEVTKDHRTEAYRKMMFVAWELGYKKDLENMVMTIARHYPVNKEGDLVDDDDKPLNTSQLFDLFPILGTSPSFYILATSLTEDPATACQLLASCHRAPLLHQSQNGFILSLSIPLHLTTFHIMSSPFLDKIRIAFPSRQAIMGFLNDEGPERAVSNRTTSESSTSEPEIIEHENIMPATSEPRVATSDATINDHMACELTEEDTSVSESTNNAPGISEPAVTGTSTCKAAACEPSVTITEPVASEPEKPIIQFDSNGDLLLRVGSDPVRGMIVDSRALCRASTELQAVLSRSGKENTNTNTNSWTVDLPDDDPTPFALLLNLIHARFEKIPAQVSVNQLYGICVLTSKYKMTEVLRPVAERWYKPIARPSNYGSLFKMAFVSWELGFADDLSQAAGHIVHNCRLNEDNQLTIGAKNKRLSEIEAFQRIPILDCIEEHRSLALEACWEECQKLSEFLLSCSIKDEMCPVQHSREEICRMMGQMQSKAEEEGILELFCYTSVFEFCQSLHLDLKTLEHKISTVAEFIDVCGWCSGVFDMVAEVRGQCRRAEDPLYLNHLEAMKVQAAKIRMMPWAAESDQEEE